MRLIAEASCAEGETIHNMPGGVTPDQGLCGAAGGRPVWTAILAEWE